MQIYETNLVQVEWCRGQKNWINAIRASCLAKQALDIFVRGILNAVHETVIGEFKPKDDDEIRQYCGLCLTKDLIPCGTKFFCLISRGNCSIHLCRPPTKCPRKICCQIVRNIKEVCLRSWTPSWKNTDARRWQDDPWEIAKCFLPTASDGFPTDSDSTSLLGWISITINCRSFHGKLSQEDLQFLKKVIISVIYFNRLLTVCGIRRSPVIVPESPGIDYIYFNLVNHENVFVSLCLKGFSSSVDVQQYGPDHRSRCKHYYFCV